MTQNSNFSTQASFLAGFQPATFEQWRAFFAQETKGDSIANPYADEGIAIEPFYTYEKDQGHPPIHNFSSVRFPNKCRPVSVIDLAWDTGKLERRLAIAQAIEAQELRCTAPDNMPLAQVVEAFTGLIQHAKEGVLLNVWFSIPQAKHFADYLAEGKGRGEGSQHLINVTMIDSLTTTRNDSNAPAARCQVALCANVLHEMKVRPALQLAIATAWAQHYANQGAQVQVQHALGQDFILSLSKLRAQRMLFHTRMPSVAFQLYACNATGNKSIENSNSNLLRLTAEGIAGVLGGADALLFTPHDSLVADTDDGFRLSLNIHQLLMHEAKLGPVCDPLRGTYVVEQLSAELVRQAESWLTQVEAWGGITTAVESGKLDEVLKAFSGK